MGLSCTRRPCLAASSTAPADAAGEELRGRATGPILNCPIHLLALCFAVLTYLTACLVAPGARGPARNVQPLPDDDDCPSAGCGNRDADHCRLDGEANSGPSGCGGNRAGGACRESGDVLGANVVPNEVPRFVGLGGWAPCTSVRARHR